MTSQRKKNSISAAERKSDSDENQETKTNEDENAKVDPGDNPDQSDKTALISDSSSSNTGKDSEFELETYVVADGKAITSKRGILGEGETVSSRDLHGGHETLTQCISKGLIVKK